VSFTYYTVLSICVMAVGFFVDTLSIEVNDKRYWELQYLKSMASMSFIIVGCVGLVVLALIRICNLM